MNNTITLTNDQFDAFEALANELMENPNTNDDLYFALQEIMEHLAFGGED